MQPVTTEAKPSFGERMKAAKAAKKATVVVKEAKSPTVQFRKAKASQHVNEVNSAQFNVQQPASQIIPPLGQPLPRLTQSPMVQAVDTPLTKEYLDDLAFAEDALTIMLQPSTEPKAPKYKDCWVNGKGIEVLKSGVWKEFKAIPLGMQVVTKRKYVEVLARAKKDTITTNTVQYRDHEDNQVLHNVVMTSGISVLHDPRGVGPGTKGREWFEKMCMVG
ncbi:MAG: hypothetical protein ABIU97_01800 [Dehalococcoidia bacterium]